MNARTGGLPPTAPATQPTTDPQDAPACPNGPACLCARIAAAPLLALAATTPGEPDPERPDWIGAALSAAMLAAAVWAYLSA